MLVKMVADGKTSDSLSAVVDENKAASAKLAEALKDAGVKLAEALKDAGVKLAEALKSISEHFRIAKSMCDSDFPLKRYESILLKMFVFFSCSCSKSRMRYV